MTHQLYQAVFEQPKAQPILKKSTKLFIIVLRPIQKHSLIVLSILLLIFYSLYLYRIVLLNLNVLCYLLLLQIQKMILQKNCSYPTIKVNMFLPLATSSSESIGAPCALERPRQARPIVVARVKGMANQVKPPEIKPQTP